MQRESSDSFRTHRRLLQAATQASRAIRPPFRPIAGLAADRFRLVGLVLEADRGANDVPTRPSLGVDNGALETLLGGGRRFPRLRTGWRTRLATKKTFAYTRRYFLFLRQS